MPGSGLLDGNFDAGNSAGCSGMSEEGWNGLLLSSYQVRSSSHASHDLLSVPNPQGGLAQDVVPRPWRSVRVQCGLLWPAQHVLGLGGGSGRA